MVCISVYYIGKMCNLVIAGFLRRVIIGQSRMTRNGLSFQSHDLNYNIRKSQEVLKDTIALTKSCVLKCLYSSQYVTIYLSMSFSIFIFLLFVIFRID